MRLYVGVAAFSGSIAVASRWSPDCCEPFMKADSLYQQIATPYLILRRAMQALCPPKPRESEIAIVSSVSTHWFGV